MDKGNHKFKGMECKYGHINKIKYSKILEREREKSLNCNICHVTATSPEGTHRRSAKTTFSFKIIVNKF